MRHDQQKKKEHPECRIAPDSLKKTKNKKQKTKNKKQKTKNKKQNEKEEKQT